VVGGAKGRGKSGGAVGQLSIDTYRGSRRLQTPINSAKTGGAISLILEIGAGKSYSPVLVQEDDC